GPTGRLRRVGPRARRVTLAGPGRMRLRRLEPQVADRGGRIGHAEEAADAVAARTAPRARFRGHDDPGVCHAWSPPRLTRGAHPTRAGGRAEPAAVPTCRKLVRLSARWRGR